MWYEKRLAAENNNAACDSSEGLAAFDESYQEAYEQCTADTAKKLSRAQQSLKTNQLKAKVIAGESISITSDIYPNGVTLTSKQKIIIDGKEILSNGGTVILGADRTILKIPQKNLNTLQKIMPKVFANNTLEQNRAAFALAKLHMEGPENMRDLIAARNEIDQMTMDYIADTYGIKKGASNLYFKQQIQQKLQSLTPTQYQLYKNKVIPQQEKIWAKYFTHVSYVEFLKISVQENLSKVTKQLYPNAAQAIREQEYKRDKLWGTINTKTTKIVTPYFPTEEVESTRERYITAMKKTFLENPPEYLRPGQNTGDPFYNIIKFVQAHNAGKPATLTIKEYKILHDMIGDKAQQDKKKKHETKVEKLVEKVEAIRSPKKNKPFHKGNFFGAQRDIIKSHSAYQLTMMSIAQDAKKIIDAPEKDGEKSGKEKYITGYGVEETNIKNKNDVQKFIENLANKKSLGYQVKNIDTDGVNVATVREFAGKINIENAALYYVVNNWGILTMVANFLVAMGNGNWEGAMPYMAMGAAVTYGSAIAVKNSWLDKWREPEHMPKWIAGEMGNGGDYKEYFANDWEVALVDNMDWKKKGVLDAFKKEYKADKKDFKDTADGTKLRNGTGTTSQMYTAQKNDTLLNRNKKKTIKQTRPDDFSEGKAFEKFLTGPVRGPDGVLYSKQDFLVQLELNGVRRGKDSRHFFRYNMLRHVATRVGKNDDILPHLHVMHDYAQQT